MTYCNYVTMSTLQINKLSAFYRGVLKQWQTSKHVFQNDVLPYKEIIWNNLNIMNTLL